MYWQMIHTQAKANGPLARGRKPTTTKDWYVKCLKEAELVDSDIISMANWGHHFYDPEINENIQTNLDINKCTLVKLLMRTRGEE